MRLGVEVHSKREALIVDRGIRSSREWKRTVGEIMEEYSCPRERVEAVLNGEPENESQRIDRAIAARYYLWHQSYEEIAKELSVTVERVEESFKMYRPKKMMNRINSSCLTASVFYFSNNFFRFSFERRIDNASFRDDGC